LGYRIGNSKIGRGKRRTGGVNVEARSVLEGGKFRKINLEMMFVDEGFGTLDDNSRKQAVNILKNMAGGSKLIGIISHVSELRDEIDEKLEVTKNESGSQAKWRIS